MDNDFDSVSWQNEPQSDNSRPNTSGPHQSDERYNSTASGKRKASSGSAPGSAQAGSNADNVDLAGIGDGRLDCTVDSPLKENDGSKDAYISYLITTQVCAMPSMSTSHFLVLLLTCVCRPTLRLSKNPS